MAIYIGVGGVAKKVIQIYGGDDYGNAKVIYKHGIVPDGYIPVEYIFNDHSATNYIDTGVKPNTYTRLIAKIAFDNNYNPSSYFNAMIIDGGSNIAIKGQRWNNGDLYIGANVGSMGWYPTTTRTIGTIYTLDLNRSANKDSYFNDTLIFTNTSSFNSDYNLWLFCNGNRGERIYSCAIYQSMLTGTLTKNYIPCIRVSDQRVGMWEAVEGVFCPGSNATSQFSNGPIIQS